MSNNVNLSQSINNNNLLINSLKQYEMGEKIGEGTFAKVILATHKITKEKVAIKIFEKFRICKKDDQMRLNREIEVLKKINHHNIIRLYSIIENESKIYIVQEYISGHELFEYIKNNRKLTEKEACLFYQQIISGIEYLHKLGIAHRDLKPENILLTDSKVLKIIDFGLSALYTKNELLTTQCGSPCYAPPEMIQGKSYRGLPSDIWSSGIILYLMLTGHLPFNEINNKKLYKKILSGKYHIPKDLSEEAKNLIKKLLELNPKKRIKINDIKEHAWFNMVNRIFSMHEGIILKKTVIPIDEEIVEEMYNIGFNKMQVRDSILRNYHNNITTTYYLLLEKKIRQKKESIADLYSYAYEKYLEDKKNEMAYYNNDIINVLKERIRSKGKIENLPEYDSYENRNNKKKRQKSFDNNSNAINNLINNNKKYMNSEGNEEEKKNNFIPLISSERNNNKNNLSTGMIKNNWQLKTSSPVKSKVTIKKKQKNQASNRINKNNDNNNSLNKIKININLNKQIHYADSEPNVKTPNNIMSLKIIHHQRNKSINNPFEKQAIKYSLFNEIKNKNKNKSLNISNRNNSINKTYLNIKNVNNLNQYKYLNGNFFSGKNVKKDGNKKYINNEKSKSKNSINIILNNENNIYIGRNNRKKNDSMQNNNDNISNYESTNNKHIQSNSVKPKKIKIKIKLKKKLTSQISLPKYIKNNNIFNSLKSNSTKNIRGKNNKNNYFEKNKISKTINKEKGNKELNGIIKVNNIQTIKFLDTNNDKKIKKNKSIDIINLENNFKPFDISTMFYMKKDKIVNFLDNFFNENNIKFKRVTTNYRRFVCSKNNAISFEIIIEKNEINKNNSIRIRILKGEKKFFVHLIKNINFLLSKKI